MILGCNDTTIHAADLQHRLRIADAETLAAREQRAPKRVARSRGGLGRSVLAAVIPGLVPARVVKPVG